MKRIIAIAILLFSSQLSFAQTKQYFYFFKTWNFIKYYHADLATGKVNADSLFLSEIEKINPQQTPNAVVDMLLKHLTKDYSNIKYIGPYGTGILMQNQNFDWYKKNPSMNENTKAALQFIFKNRFIADNHFYLTKQGWESSLPNEKQYDFKKEENLPLAYRLLALAKIQGVVDYLYPYKYLMPVSFDSVVAEQLPKVINCTTRKDFEEILARLVATLEDTHAFSFYRQLNYKKDIFHAAHYPPFEYKVFKDHILVTSIISPAVCSKANIRPGDKIIAINNQKVTGLIAEKSKLLSVSNKEVLVYRLSDYLSNLIWNNDSLTNSFTVLSGGKEKKVTVEFISMADKNGTKEINEYFQRKQTEKKKPIEDTAIAYFNISNTFHFISDIDDDKVDAKMDEILGEASTKKAIVFDMRAYPDWGGFVHTYIYKYFSEKNNYYHRIYFPNPKNIGTWEYQKRSLEYFPDIPGKTRHVYKGKVFILVNPETLSASELYTMSLQHIFPGSITIGQTTAGADGNIKTMNLPGGYAFSFTGLSVLYPNSSLTQKVGIKINTYISYSNEDILMKRDKEMEKVMELLK